MFAMGGRPTLAASLIQNRLTRRVRPDLGSGNASAVMQSRSADMMFDEALRKAQVHHLHPQEEKAGFPCKRVVVELERFNGRKLRELFVRRDLTSARRKSAEVAHIH